MRVAMLSPPLCASPITGREHTGRRVAAVTMRPDQADHGWASTAATVPVRNETMRAPAVTAAVSARNTLRPKPTVGSPDASSSVLHPPSGPTATTCWCADGRSPLSCARTTSPGAPSAGSRRSARCRDLGQPDPATLGGRLAGDPAQPLDRGLAARPVPAHHAALADERDDAVDAELGQLLDDPFGPLALYRREGDGERRHGRGLRLHRAVASDARARRRRGASSAPPCQAVRAQRPRPSAAMTSSPGRKRSTRPRWCTSSSARTAGAGSSTKTCAVAAARTVMAA